MALLDAHKRQVLDAVFAERLFIRTQDLAKLLSVSVRSIQTWVAAGHIDYCDTTPGGGFLFDRATVEEIIKHSIIGKLLGDPTEPDSQSPSICGDDH